MFFIDEVAFIVRRSPRRGSLTLVQCVVLTYPCGKATKGTKMIKFHQAFPCKTKDGTKLFRLKKRVLYLSMGKFLGVIGGIFTKIPPKNRVP